MIRIIQNSIKNILEHARDNAVIAMAKVNNKITLEFNNKFDINDKVDPNRIFDLFYKSDSARSKSSSGIGLTVVKELVKITMTIDYKRLLRHCIEEKISMHFTQYRHIEKLLTHIYIYDIL